MPLATDTQLAGILTFAFCMTSENMKARSISCWSTWKAKLLACAAGRVPLDPDHKTGPRC